MPGPRHGNRYNGRYGRRRTIATVYWCMAASLIDRGKGCENAFLWSFPLGRNPFSASAGILGNVPQHLHDETELTCQAQRGGAAVCGREHADDDPL